MFSFLKSRRGAALTALLAAEAVFYIAYPKQEIVILPRPLKTLPAELGQWHMAAESEISAEEQGVLKSDDTLNRVYVDRATETPANLFIAFFKTQKTGVAPHSPKVCLPGSGWEPTETGILAIPVPGRAEPIRVNHSIIVNGERRSVVLYWYQTHNKVLADEYGAKLNTILDSLRFRRSDTSIVRIIVSESPGINADAEARQLAQQSFAAIRELLPQ
ncbi:MAG: exosortase C-terminal domain/associated protein EpsI [Bryobacteraceae bacterium]